MLYRARDFNSSTKDMDSQLALEVTVGLATAFAGSRQAAHQPRCHP